MFRKTPSVQVNMFRDIAGQVSGRKSKLLSDPQGWHNVFYQEVIRRIDETEFCKLFCQDNGRPNASVKVLLGMMILKEGNGWSDEQLFDQSRFNLRVMRALGLAHLDDDVPVESTYYDFRRRLVQYNTTHDTDLISQSFKTITGSQIESYNVKGEKIRLDSKLIQSNIAKSTRLELVLEAVRKHIAHIDISALSDVLSTQDIELLEALKGKKTTNITYPLDNSQKQDLLQRLGWVIKCLLSGFPGTASGESMLQRIFTEQYDESPPKKEDNKTTEASPAPDVPVLKPASEIPASSIQSAHDPEAAYRSKGQGNNKQQVSGYHANITETCGEYNDINLITDVAVAAANVSENEFLLPAIQESQLVLEQGQIDTEQTINHVSNDGGYDSTANRAAMEAEDMPHWNMHNHKGSQLRYRLSRDEQGNLRAWDKKTEQFCTVVFSDKTGKHIITHADNTKRYLTEEQIENYLQVQQHLDTLRPEDINIRPNVEATIHQVFHRLLNRQKIKYRGLFKCRMYVTSRAFWANFRRILGKEAELAVVFAVFILTTLVFSQGWPLAHFKTRGEKVASRKNKYHK
jgi:hypothetical protein